MASTEQLKRFTVKVTVPAGLVAAVIVALTGKHPVGLSNQQIAQYVAAVLAGITAAVHAPAVKKAAHKVTSRHRSAKPRAEFLDAMDTIGGTSGNIPRACKRVLAYITGQGIAWTGAQIAAAAKHAQVLAIDQSNGTFPFLAYRTLILDIEPGAKTIANAIIQTRLRAQHGLRTCLYTFAANVPELTREVAAAGLTEHVDGFVADWNLSHQGAIDYLRSNPRVVGVQWASPTSNPDTTAPGTSRTLRELNIDLSVTRGSWAASG